MHDPFTLFIYSLPFYLCAVILPFCFVFFPPLISIFYGYLKPNICPCQFIQASNLWSATEQMVTLASNSTYLILHVYSRGIPLWPSPRKCWIMNEFGYVVCGRVRKLDCKRYKQCIFFPPLKWGLFL